MASPPPPDNTLYGDADGPAPSIPEPSQNPTSPTTTPMTRTLAIIKTHALTHRFEIEKRIQEASFEIVKERQMEFDTETDPETLEELFGEDAGSLAEGPVWVYVLERRRAVEVWNTLMGDRDPEVARHEAPNCLRALYGLSYDRNGLMGSSDNQMAEIQIASLFVSSPPFPTTDLPAEDRLDTLSSSVYAALQRSTSDPSYARSDVTNGSTVNGGSQGKRNLNGKILFKARPIPATLDKPDIVPRTTRAAALRAGQVVEKTSSTPRAPISKDRLAQTFANVPGHKRNTTISVASTAAPTIAPRMSRAASLRLGQPTAAPPIRKRSLTNEEQTKHGAASMFEGVPGHKRRESISVASTKAPTMAPRLNKSAALRVQKDQAGPPSSFKGPPPKAATLSRASSSSSLSPPRQIPPRPASQASIQVSPSKAAPTTISRASSALGGRSSLKPRLSTTAAPTIAPRTNRSAALRAAKMEAENAAAAAAATKKGPRMSKAPPSSFKSVVS